MITRPDQGFIHIQSSELFFLENELADIGSRAFAYIIDLVIRILIVILFIAIFTANLAITAPLYKLFLPLIFIWWNGYFVLFEMIFAGKTPGKKVAGIRTIRTDGSALSLLDSCIRNILRLIDSLPLGYVLAFPVMMLDRHNRRIGDIVANTIVIHDRSSNKSMKVFLDNTIIESQPRENIVLKGIDRLSQQDRLIIKNLYSRFSSMKPGVEKDQIMNKFYDIMASKISIEGTIDPEILLCELNKRI